MQVSIEVQKELYDKVVSSGVDMQRKFNEYLRSQLEENSYMDSAQFEEDRAYLQKIHKEIKNGDVTLLSHDEAWEEINKHLETL